MIKEVTEIHQKYQGEIKGLKEIIGKELEKEEKKRYQVEGVSLAETIRRLGGEVEAKKEEIKVKEKEVEGLNKEAAKQRQAVEDAQA